MCAAGVPHLYPRRGDGVFRTAQTPRRHGVRDLVTHLYTTQDFTHLGGRQSTVQHGAIELACFRPADDAAEVLDVVRGLKTDGMTMLFATHEMAFAREISDRVCFLHKGRILEQGPPDQIFGEPQEPRTREFLQRVIDSGRL